MALEDLLSRNDIPDDVKESIRKEISERKDINNKYPCLLEHLQEGIWQMDDKGNTTFVNSCMAAMLNYSKEEMAGKPIFSFMDEKGRDFAREKMKDRCAGVQDVCEFDFEFIRKDGTNIATKMKTTSINSEDGGYLGTLAAVEDLTSQRKIEEALKTEKSYLDQLFESAQQAIVMANNDGSIIRANHEFCRLFGYSLDETIGQFVDDLVATEKDMEEAVNVTRYAADGNKTELEAVRRRKDGKFINVAILASPIVINDEQVAVYAIYRDITARVKAETEKDRLQNQLIHAQKMDAFGQLSGGVAHDFNNLLTAVMGYSDLLLHDIDKNDRRYSMISQIKKAAERGQDLTRQLLAFSRRQPAEPIVIELNDKIYDFKKMLDHIVGENIDLQITTAKGPTKIRIDPGQLEQVLMNLALNAKDAMDTHGQLTIETKEEYLIGMQKSHEISTGHYAALKISDSGRGMDPKTQTRIFEPFYTTKEKGTGLGLSVVYGIIKQNGGDIRVTSSPGEGTTFNIYLPLASENITRQKRITTSIKTGTETILLVEDEELVRNLAQESLEIAGYQVLPASDGKEALEVFEKNKETIDLLLTDVIMPGMHGPDVARHIQQSKPEIKVLYISGYTANSLGEKGLLDPGTSLLEKPFTPASLSRKVRDAFNGG